MIRKETFYLNASMKIVLSVLLFLCLLDMSYGYYQLVRFIATFVFCYLAFVVINAEIRNDLLIAIYIALAVLFQPLIKIALGRTIWNIVDVLVGVFLIVSIVFEYRSFRKP